MPEILGRVDFDTVPMCLQQCRKFCIEMRVVLQSQMSHLALKKAEIPQNLLNARIVTERHWNKNQIQEKNR